MMATKNLENTATVVSEEGVGQAVVVAAVEPETTASDTTVPGGRYEVNGKLVDANGKPIKESKKDEDGE